MNEKDKKVVGRINDKLNTICFRHKCANCPFSHRGFCTVQSIRYFLDNALEGKNETIEQLEAKKKGSK